MTTEDIRICASFCASKREYMEDPGRWDAYAEDHLMKHIAFLLQKEHSELIMTEDRAERRIDLYAASPELFWKIVNQEAEKIAMRFMRR